MKGLQIAGVISLALILGGCSQTFKDYLRDTAEKVACKVGEKQYLEWVEKGRPVEKGGKDEAAVIRAGIELAHKELREFCAKRGIVIQ